MARWHRLATLTLGAGLLGGGALLAVADSAAAAGNALQATFNVVAVAEDEDGAEREGPAGALDDGEEYLGQATISLEAAIAAAQTTDPGAAIGEVDLEWIDGLLVYNVDVGATDVKVDATTGAIVAVATDD